MYRAVATSVTAFVQQLAVSYLRNGYWFYVAGLIPEGKHPPDVDAKLLEKYGIDISKWERARCKSTGKASLQYIRYDRLFLILATHGRHAFFQDEASSIRDARRTPIRFYGYSISYRGGHPHVRIEQNQYKLLKAYFLEHALRPAPELEEGFRNIGFAPYAPVRRQLLNLHRAVNRRRSVAGRPLLPFTVLPLKRRAHRGPLVVAWNQVTPQAAQASPQEGKKGEGGGLEPGGVRGVPKQPGGKASPASGRRG